MQFILKTTGAIAFLLASTWIVWMLWCWVVPQLWATGPANIINPGFWLFLGAWLLVCFIGRAMAGKS